MSGSLDAREALQTLLKGTGLVVAKDDGRTIVLQMRPQSVVAAEAQVVDEVVVTGTRLRGGAIISQVQTLNASDMRRRGYASVQEIISTLPANAGGDYDSETTGSRGSSGGGFNDTLNNRSRSGSANLRGLGASATLVALDGHRLPVGGNGYSIDLSLIPLAAVERLEVLPDGASSIYGADAIGGVINLISRKSADQWESSARYAVAKGYEKVQASQTLGKSWASGSLFAAYQYDSTTSLAYGERAATRVMLTGASQLNGLILPESRQNSLYATLRQSLSDRLDATVTALYSRSIYDDTIINDVTTLSRSRSDNEQDMLSVNLDYRLGGTWKLNTYAQVANAYSKPTLGRISRVDGAAAPLLVDNTYKGRETALEASLTGELLQLPGGGVQTAFGAAVRRERRSYQGFGDGLPLFDAARDIRSVYAEAVAPLVSEAMDVPGVRALTLAPSIRYDDYSDFGHTLNPKIGLAWSPIADLLLRGAYSTSFRAPSLRDQFGRVTSVLGRRVTSTSIPGGFGVGLFINGNPLPGLKPETSKNYTTGFDYTPAWAHGLKVSAGYFRVDFTNRLGRPNQTVANTDNLDAADVQPFIRRNPTLAEVQAVLALTPTFGNLSGLPFDPTRVFSIFDNRTINLATFKTDGLDVDVNYSRDTRLGRVYLASQSTITLSYDVQTRPGGPVRSYEGQVYFRPRLRERLSVDLLHGAWRGGLAMSYRSGLDDLRSPARPRREASWTTFDGNLSTDLTSVAPILQGVSVELSITNLFDKLAPYLLPATSTEPAYDAANGSILGRMMQIRLVKRW
nr:TonB-dependent receptor [Caulobacter sp. 602-1]